MAHRHVQKLWSGWGETLHALSSISLKVLTQRYVCPPTGQRGQSAHYKQLWMKYEAFLITPGSSEGVILLAAADDVRVERRLTSSRQRRTTRWPSLQRFTSQSSAASDLLPSSDLREDVGFFLLLTWSNATTPLCFRTSLVLFFFHPQCKTSLDCLR